MSSENVHYNVTTRDDVKAAILDAAVTDVADQMDKEPNEGRGPGGDGKITRAEAIAALVLDADEAGLIDIADRIDIDDIVEVSGR